MEGIETDIGGAFLRDGNGSKQQNRNKKSPLSRIGRRGAHAFGLNIRWCQKLKRNPARFRLILPDRHIPEHVRTGGKIKKTGLESGLYHPPDRSCMA
jgi:hypothetical protein